MMLDSFTQFVQQYQLFSPADKILLAVSGGIDSMVMVNLFSRAGYRFGIVHCNFCLRGRSSDGDEKLVENTANRLNVPYHVTRFDTEEYAKNHKLSIQMAARQLRYGFFEEICEKAHYDYVAVAHHEDDAIETFFINLGRGTGIHGLTGIRVKVGKVIRPMLFATRYRILNYANKHRVEFREDASNASDKYIRNSIRHYVIPAFEAIFPSYHEQMRHNMEKIVEIEKIYDDYVQKEIDRITTLQDPYLYVDIPALKSSVSPSNILYELFKHYNFSPSQVEELESILRQVSPSGKQIIGSTHRVVVDHDRLQVVRLSDDAENPNALLINRTDTVIENPCSLYFKTVLIDRFELKKDSQIAQIDADLVTYPLVLRKWESGDFFYPLGMEGRKKMSDYWIDRKLSIVDKFRQWVLCSADDTVIWIVGDRIDNRFKVTLETKRVLCISTSSWGD